MKFFKYITLVLALSVFQNLLGQENDKGNVNIHVGTMLFYNTYSLGYESFDFTKNLQKLQIRGNVKTGIWSASVVNSNRGFQSAIGVSLAYGNFHKLEFSNDLVLHFDKSLNQKGVSYIATTYRPFIGYRFQNPEKKLIFRLGIGWREVIQCGIGFNI